MRLEINRLEGLRNDLSLRLERAEIDAAHLSVPHRRRLMALPGMPRHREATPDETKGVAECKIPIEEHLRHLGILDATGKPQCRAIAIGNRNLGANHGNIAWQRSASPPIFRIAEDPCSYAAHSCLTAWRDGSLSIEDLRFDFEAQCVYSVPDGDTEAGTNREAGTNLSDQIEWATFGQRVLRAGSLTAIEDIIDQFSDLRHVLAFDHHKDHGVRVRDDSYRGYPARFRENALAAWRDAGVPRARYFHNAIGFSRDALFVVQREGTVEEVGAALLAAGADDGIILDNGGSVVCWAWWLNQYRGGIVSPTIDYRPPGTSAIAFVLKGPVSHDLPGGSVSYSVL
jgi:hypothetical protein